MLAKYELKKVWSKFGNVTPVYGAWWKTFIVEHLNDCSLLFPFKGLKEC